jgi:hypothetical protein
MVDINLVSRELEVTFATANKLVEQLERLEIIIETTGRKRDRIFRFEPYLRLFEQEERERVADTGELQETAPSE